MSAHPRGPFTYPYPRPSVTVDVAIVSMESSPRVLLIQRKHDPFSGRWALPGGFVDENEPLMSAARRELQEETGLANIELQQLHTFGDPGRDPRGWTISVAYLARVNPDQVRPVAADDADAVGWFALAELPPLAFDHDQIMSLVRSAV